MEREELGALFARATARLIGAEKSLLAARGLSMWNYIVLSELARSPAGMQADLAKAIRYDKTRLISLLDALERDGLITRSPDPSDRRARRVSLTSKGRKLQALAQADIRAMEAEVLSDLSGTEERALLRALSRLAGEARGERD